MSGFGNLPFEQVPCEGLCASKGHYIRAVMTKGSRRDSLDWVLPGVLLETEAPEANTDGLQSSGRLSCLAVHSLSSGVPDFDSNPASALT